MTINLCCLQAVEKNLASLNLQVLCVQGLLVGNDPQVS